ncbi:UGT-57 protein [Aphelenchoides avenae]|nr:UGT-57 protein [Aphelenchus avenae]
MASIMEAVAHGVPMVGIPLYGFNYQNLLKVQAKGLGRILAKSDLTEKSLATAMKDVLENPKYAATARDLSKAYKGRPTTAFDTVLYWVEHIAKHRSAKFLRPPPSHGLTKFLRTSNLDFHVIVLSAFALSVFLAYNFLHLAFACFCHRKPKVEAVRSRVSGSDQKASSTTASSIRQRR